MGKGLFPQRLVNGQHAQEKMPHIISHEGNANPRHPFTRSGRPAMRQTTRRSGGAGNQTLTHCCWARNNAAASENSLEVSQLKLANDPAIPLQRELKICSHNTSFTNALCGIILL